MKTYDTALALAAASLFATTLPAAAPPPIPEIFRMRLSRFFLPILRETPKDAEIASHRLMLRAGMLRQEAAGIYTLLPLGLRVLNKINAIIRADSIIYVDLWYHGY